MALSGLFAFSTFILSASATPVKRQAGLPQFVLDYSPLVYLHSQDPYKPSDILDTVRNTEPRVDFQIVGQGPYDLNNLDQLNSVGDNRVYLTSKQDVTTNPAWLEGVAPNAEGKTEGAISSVIITVDRGSGRLDAFYFHYYANNWGGLVFQNKDLNFGNHVGDWEHNMVRFQDGQPSELWYSQHATGQAFAYNGLKKEGQHPIAFSSNGSHALYARTGANSHAIPGSNFPWTGILTDFTEKGRLWDPTKSAYSYSYDPNTQVFTPYDPSFPVAFLNYNGQWGDQAYPDSDKRQKDLFGNKKYSGGPNGPKFKNLIRQNVCPDSVKPCVVRPFVTRRDISEVVAAFDEEE